MKKISLSVAILCIIFSITTLPAFAQSANPNGVEPDNTGVNIRDRSAVEPTADQGSNQKSDRDIMQSIRKSVMADKSLSTYAHNIKIISANGKVTLKGPVRSGAEAKNIEDKADEVAGAANVTNELAVKTDQ